MPNQIALDFDEFDDEHAGIDSEAYLKCDTSPLEPFESPYIIHKAHLWNKRPDDEQ